MFSDPEKNIAQLGLRDGMKVADFGAGSGFYSVASAKIVGNNGKVYAIEVQEDLLKNIREKANKENLSNIDYIWSDVEKPRGSKLADNSMDAVIISNILFQAPDKVAIVKEAYRILKIGGKVLFVDWSDSFRGMGPAPEMILSKITGISIFEGIGFKKDNEIRAGDHHYGIIFVK